MLKDKLQADLKAAMLGRETEKVDTLKGLKSAILYAEVEKGKREEGLSDDEILTVFVREVKKRQDAIVLYKQGGNDAMANKEQAEKELIETYLPDQLSDDEINKLIDESLNELGIEKMSSQDMGRVIGVVKAKVGASADGSVIARLTKERIAN